MVWSGSDVEEPFQAALTQGYPEVHKVRLAAGSITPGGVWRVPV
jgi:hypothetical protein